MKNSTLNNVLENIFNGCYVYSYMDFGDTYFTERLEGEVRHCFPLIKYQIGYDRVEDQNVILLTSQVDSVDYPEKGIVIDRDVDVFKFELLEKLKYVNIDLCITEDYKIFMDFYHDHYSKTLTRYRR